MFIIYFMYYIFIINLIFHLNKDFSLIYLLYKSDVESKSMFGEQSRVFTFWNITNSNTSNTQLVTYLSEC